MLVVLRVSKEMILDRREPFARTHTAESVDIHGVRWYLKACRSDREAVGLIDPGRSGLRRTRVYCYLGGGGLTEASTNLAQGVVLQNKELGDGSGCVCGRVAHHGCRARAKGLP